MIEEFLSSWSLFHDSYLVGWLALVLLSMVGVIVVARDQIFIGAAVSQASTLGIAVAIWLGSLPVFADVEWMHEQVESLHSSWLLAVSAVLFSILAALLTSKRATRGETTHESTTGWVFLVSASLSVLLVYRSPHGMEEVQNLMASGIIGATSDEVWLFVGLVALVGGFLLVVRRRALLVLMDEEMARSLGIRTGAWNVGFACLLGLTVGFSLRCVGMLYTFGSLVLPCLAARNLCRRSLPMLVVGPLVGLITGVASFVLANHWDQPPGQLTVALLCAVVAVTTLWKRLVSWP